MAKNEVVEGKIISAVISPNYREVYSNQAKMAATPWDFRVTFAHIKPTDQGALGTDEVTVIMSPQHAKAFITHWERTVKSYEEMYGEIQDPSSKVLELRDKATSDQKQNEAKSEGKKAKTQKKTEAH